MRCSYQLPLVGILLFLLIPSQLCKICEVSKEDLHLNLLLNTMINSKYTSETQPANVLLSLRLIGIHDQTQTQRLVQRVKNNVERKDSNLSSGQLAVIILALGACHSPDEIFTYDKHLLSHLENKFQGELENMKAHDGNPLTNFYQLGLDVLALCLFNGSYSATEVAEFFNHYKKNYYFGGQFSVDTGAMAVLALTCVNRSLTNEQIKADKNLKKIDELISFLVEKIMSEKKENGLIGNTFSTGVAMQALFVSSNYYNESEWDCQQTLDTILQEISQGVFNNPTAAAQILPPLMGRTYLDVEDCPYVSGLDTFNISNHVPESERSNSSSLIMVYYSVVINETYSINVTVPNGSVFLDVMKAAQKKNETTFGFTMEQSSWGPYITSVQGLYANNNKRTYWELLSDGKALSQGVGSYVVHEEENLEIRWSTY
ncbi:transcobalamin-1 [Sciurus carolinensis]|uniref:transcobalamin-1 n=1 Tax=Sciurus carolinensis TaxID=30640 RepID=UPI001FB5001D|nr:transcobalamin-1 [Sciurus carolinensis]